MDAMEVEPMKNHHKMIQQEGAASINRAIANQATYNRVMRNSSNGRGGAIGRHLGIPGAYGNMAMQDQQMEMSNFMNSPKATKMTQGPSFDNLGSSKRLSDAFFGSQLGQHSPDAPATSFGKASKPALMTASLLVSATLVFAAYQLYFKR